MYKLTRENTKVNVDVTVSNEELEDMLEHIYQETKSKYNVVGFRKGHAPRKMIEKQYGDNVFFDDAIEHFMLQTPLHSNNQHNPQLHCHHFVLVCQLSYM